MFYSQRLWLSTAIVITALATLAGVAMIEVSPLLALAPLAPVALVLGGLFVFAVGKGQPWALCVVLAVVMIGFAVDWRGEAAGTRQTGVDAVAQLKLAMFMLALLAGIGSLDAVKKRALETPMLPLILLVLWSIFSAIFSIKPDLTMVATVGFSGLILFAVALNERVELEKIIFVLISAGSIYCFGSLIAFFFFPTFGQFVSFNVVRLSGLASTTNESAQIAALTLISILAFYLSGYHRGGLGASGKRWIYISFAGAAAVLLLTDSRGALASLILAAIAISLQHYRMVRGAFLISVIAVSLITVAFLLSPRTFDIVAGLAGGVSRSGNVSEILSLAGRADIWSFTAGYIFENPIIGAGYGQGAFILKENYVPTWGVASGSAHNAYLQIMMDLGMVGGALLVILFLWSIREFFRNPSPFRDGIFVIVFIASIQESSVSKAASTLTLIWLVSLFSQPKKPHAEPAELTELAEPSPD